MHETTTQFDILLATWKAAATVHVKAEELYRVAHAKATAASLGKNAESRKADADEATSDLRITRNLAEIERDAAYHALVFVRGSAGEPQR